MANQQTNYRGYQQSTAPTFLAQPYGSAFMYALGYAKDVLLDRLKQSILARFPLYAPVDALSATGFERGIFRGPNEGQAAYAGRVANAWNAWAFAGTPYGILSQLNSAGYPDVAILSRKNIYTMATLNTMVTGPTGTGGWQPGYPTLNAPQWNVFTVIVDHPYPAAWLSSGNWSTPIHIGAGGGTVTPSGVPNPDANYCVQISTGGVAGVGQYKLSTDGGVTFGAAVTIAASNPISGSAVWASAGLYVLNDRYYFSQVPPVDGGIDSALFRAVLTAWKPAHAVCESIKVLKTGRLIGYPVRTLGAANGVLGGASFTSWAPPS